MSKKIKIYRQCIVNKKIFGRENLIRIVKTKDNKIIVDLKQKISGRGFYVQNDVGVVKILRKRKILEKIFKLSESDKILTEIYNLLEHITSSEKK